MDIFNVQFKLRLAILLTVFSFELTCIYCQRLATNDYSMDLTHELIIPKKYIINPAIGTLHIDGIANEASWSKAKWTESFIDIEGIKIPKHRTRVKMLWDDHFLYIYAELDEPHVAANITQHDSIMFYDKDFEVFIDHNDDTYQYMELEINAHNATWDLYLDRPYRSGGVALDEYEMIGLQHAVHVDGTLNNASDLDKSWSIELAIPFETILKRRNNGVRAGDCWRMNFSRVHWDQEFKDGIYHRARNDDGTLKKEYNWVWSNQGTINMHQPELWGYVFFSNGNATIFELPEDHCDQQVTYAVFRTFRKNPWRKLKNSEPGFKQVFDIQGCDGQDFEGSFLKTNMGFELLIENKTAQRTFVIDQLGRLKKLK